MKCALFDRVCDLNDNNIYQNKDLIWFCILMNNSVVVCERFMEKTLCSYLIAITKITCRLQYAFDSSQTIEYAITISPFMVDLLSVDNTDLLHDLFWGG